MHLVRTEQTFRHLQHRLVGSPTTAARLAVYFMFDRIPVVFLSSRGVKEVIYGGSKKSCHMFCNDFQVFYRSATAGLFFPINETKHSANNLKFSPHVLTLREQFGNFWGSKHLLARDT